MDKTLFQPTKVTSLKRFENGTATAKAMLIYSQDTPVVDTNHTRVLLNDSFIRDLGVRFNRDHKGLLGFGKRYPKMVMEHQYKASEVVGRIDSPIDIREVNIDGQPRTALFCDVLLTEPEIIDRISNEELSGLSAGIYWDSQGTPYLKELTLTSNPALKKAVLLSNHGETIQYSTSTLVTKIMKLEDQIEELGKMHRSYENKLNEKILLSAEIQHTKLQETLKVENVRKVLLNQVFKNKLIRKDVEFLTDKCSEVPPEALEALFSKVAPLKKYRGATFKPQTNSIN
jgi:hypothetical protein